METKRIHHTLSKVEYKYLMLLNWMDPVADIREQYPLEFKRTLEISQQLNIPHAHLDNEPVQTSTDFMITVDQRKGPVDVVRTVKEAKDLTTRTLELFEIEKRYFKEQGIDWGVIIEKNLPINMIRNIEWMFEGKFLDSRPGLDHEVVEYIKNPLLDHLIYDGGATPVQKLCLEADSKFGLEKGACMFILKHLFANKKCFTDMNKLIRPSSPLIIQKEMIK